MIIEEVNKQVKAKTIAEIVKQQMSTVDDEKFAKLVEDKVDEKEHEILERQNREKNVIIFKLNEPNTNIIAERQAIDLDSVNKMIDIMNTENEQEVAVERFQIRSMGQKYIQNPGPIIVSFTNLEEKKSFLRNSQALKDCEDENVKKCLLPMILQNKTEKKKLNLLILEGKKT